MKNTISAILIIYNEEKRLKKCLDSICDVVDEIVVVHDGPCKDRSLEICKKYGAKIFIREHVGCSDPHIPFIIEQAKSKWILKIDADESISSNLRKNLKKIVNNNNINAFRFKWIAEIRGKRSTFMSKQILFLKEKIYSVGLPHFQIETYGKLEKSDFELLHDTYEFDSSFELLKSYFKKDKKWGKLSAKMFFNFNEIPVYNCDLKKTNIKQIKKIKLIKNFPMLALLIIPLYSFCYCFFKNKFYKQGWMGFVLSLHVPLHSFYTCYYLILYRFKIYKI